VRKLVPILLGAVGVGFTVIYFAARKRVQGATISYDTPTARSGGYAVTTTIPKALTPEIINSARKWAQARGIPLQEVLATILVESSGNPRAWANLSTEDSRGLMQVNVRAWQFLLTQNGMTVDDLWDIDKNIMIGTYIYAKYRAELQGLISQSGCPQSAPIDVLTRLYYKGPAYVRSKISACKDASSPYVNADKAIANWQAAMNKVSVIA
jgi:soluble lytic murein transglycosylase-like protein